MPKENLLFIFKVTFLYRNTRGFSSGGFFSVCFLFWGFFCVFVCFGGLFLFPNAFPKLGGL